MGFKESGLVSGEPCTSYFDGICDSESADREKGSDYLGGLLSSKTLSELVISVFIGADASGKDVGLFRPLCEVGNVGSHPIYLTVLCVFREITYICV